MSNGYEAPFLSCCKLRRFISRSPQIRSQHTAKRKKVKLMNEPTEPRNLYFFDKEEYRYTLLLDGTTYTCAHTNHILNIIHTTTSTYITSTYITSTFVPMHKQPVPVPHSVSAHRDILILVTSKTQKPKGCRIGKTTIGNQQFNITTTPGTGSGTSTSQHNFGIVVYNSSFICPKI